MKLIEPYTPEEFKAYFNARWEFLRKPQGFPKGSEIDNFENISIHLMAVEKKEILGVGRLTYFNNGEGQIRYMGVHELHRNKFVGRKILEYLENEAKNLELTLIYLNAREGALTFYQNNGFKSVGKPFKGFADVVHFRMEKKL
ncbi:MAG: GNAT family N-acetyltransferase [Vicingaceae bacterium]